MDAILRKTCHGSSTFICEMILIKLHTNVTYDNIWNKKFTFQFCASKVKVTVAYGGGGEGAFITFSDCTVSLFFFGNFPICLIYKSGSHFCSRIFMNFHSEN